MGRIIAAINMTLDGFCDHTAILPDDEIHRHYAELINGSDVILYGRITYELMQYWQPFVKDPSGEKSMVDFALSMDRIPKIVFSNTLQATEWNSATLAAKPLEKVVEEFRQQPDKTILIGSRSLILQLMDLDLIDEYQICIHPVLAREGLPLFDGKSEKKIFSLLRTKQFASGAVLFYYANA